MLLLSNIICSNRKSRWHIWSLCIYWKASTNWTNIFTASVSSKRFLEIINEDNSVDKYSVIRKIYWDDSYISYKVNILRCFNILRTSISFWIRIISSGFWRKEDLLIIFMATLSLVYLDIPEYIFENPPSFIFSFISYAPILLGRFSYSSDGFLSFVELLIFYFWKNYFLILVINS